MIVLTVAQVIALHDSEDSSALRDRGLLEGAVGAPHSTWDGMPLHRTLLEKAAVLMVRIAEAQAFVDGNKRTAWLAAVTFLSLNGLELATDRSSAAERLLVDISARQANVADVSIWLAGRLA